MKEIMTLRDKFAARALQGLLANSHLQKEFLKDVSKIFKIMELSEEEMKGKKAEYMQRQHAFISYAFADAMLKEREKSKSMKD